MSKIEQTTEERLQKFNEKKARVYRQIVKDALKNSKQFAQLKDAYLKNKKVLFEAENILTEEGFTKVKEKLEKRKEEIQQEIDQLESKKDIAQVGIEKVRTVVKTHEELHSRLGEALIERVSDLSTEEEVEEIVQEVLKGVDTSELLQVVNIFE